MSIADAAYEPTEFERLLVESNSKRTSDLEAALTETLALLQRLEDWGCNEDRMLKDTREKKLMKLISDAQTVLHKHRKNP